MQLARQASTELGERRKSDMALLSARARSAAIAGAYGRAQARRGSDSADALRAHLADRPSYMVLPPERTMLE